MHTPEYDSVPGIETVYKKFKGNAINGLINQNPDNCEWMIQRCLFETLIERFLRRPIVPRKGRFLKGCSRLYAMCTPAWFNYFTSIDGSYYPCERVPKCKEFKIGDVWGGIDVDKSYSLKKKYIELCEDDCQHCWCVNFCHVGCCSSVRDGKKLTPKSKQKACVQYRDNVHRMLTGLFDILELNPHAFDYLKKKVVH